jgi:hypothetical protein
VKQLLWSKSAGKTKMKLILFARQKPQESVSNFYTLHTAHTSHLTRPTTKSTKQNFQKYIYGFELNTDAGVVLFT